MVDQAFTAYNTMFYIKEWIHTHEKTRFQEVFKSIIPRNTMILNGFHGVQYHCEGCATLFDLILCLPLRVDFLAFIGLLFSAYFKSAVNRVYVIYWLSVVIIA